MQKEIPEPFVIAANGRSGSHFLMSLLNSTKKVGFIGEQIDYQKILGGDSDKENLPPDAVVLSHFKNFYERATSIPNPSGLWGTKCDISQLFVFKRFLDICNLEPRELKWIWLSRKNRIRQAISFFRADATGIWELVETDGKEVRERARSGIDATVPDIFARAGRIHFFDLLWECFFMDNEIIPYKIYYEDFIDPSTWESTVAGIFDFLNVDYKLPLEVSTEWIKIGEKKHEAYKDILGRINEEKIPVKLDNRLLI